MFSTLIITITDKHIVWQGHTQESLLSEGKRKKRNKQTNPKTNKQKNASKLWEKSIFQRKTITRMTMKPHRRLLNSIPNSVVHFSKFRHSKVIISNLFLCEEWGRNVFENYLPLPVDAEADMPKVSVYQLREDFGENRFRCGSGVIKILGQTCNQVKCNVSLVLILDLRQS